MRKRGDIANENQEHMSLVADLYAFFIKHQELNHAKILEQDYLLYSIQVAAEALSFCCICADLV